MCVCTAFPNAAFAIEPLKVGGNDRIGRRNHPFLVLRTVGTRHWPKRCHCLSPADQQVYTDPLAIKAPKVA